MKQQHTLQPKLRFPEFEGDWEKKKFNNYVKLSQGLQIPISERYIEYVEGSYFYITNEFLNKNSKNKYYILNPAKSVLCTEDDILMTRTGNTGKVVTNVNGAFHNNFFRIAYNKNVYKDFLYYFLINPKVQHIILSRAGTSTIPDLNHSDFYSMYFSKPSLPEQQKIANYLSTIDTKINLLEEKKTQLALYKKAMMQKLFAQEIRFKDDNGNDFPEWNEKRLGEIFSGLKGQGLSKDSLLDEGENNCILYGELFTKYKEVIKSVISKTNTLSSVKSKSGDILIPASTTTNAFDLANATALLLDNVILGGDINILRPKQKLSSEFYAYYLSNYKKHELGKLGQGITIVHLYYTHFKNILIDLPSLPEQQKIAEFLSAIDESIEKVTEQMSQTQSFKKAMLQQMFV